ncbi:NrfJ-related protein [hydrothermal vent metagenome]|uniref:NrfJ-related protein n=1 Tax=hydrothermal vent metagenome TaxID=652676 RepID=A0A1W1CJR9_9ZZZZ
MKKILALVFLLSCSTVIAEVNQSTPTTKEVNTLYYQGTAVTVRQGGSYTYIEVKEKTELTFWVAVSQAEVKVGDIVRFQKELVAKNFKSKALNQTFKELMFASNLEYKVSK